MTGTGRIAWPGWPWTLAAPAKGCSAGTNSISGASWLLSPGARVAPSSMRFELVQLFGGTATPVFTNMAYTDCGAGGGGAPRKSGASWVKGIGCPQLASANTAAHNVTPSPANPSLPRICPHLQVHCDVV